MSSKTHEYNMEPLARVLLATAGLLGAFTFLQIVLFLVAASDAEGVVAGAMGAALGKTAAPPSAQIRSAVEGLKKNNLFAPPAAKQNPVREVIGILGNQALINGQWYKVGDMVADAKILAIEPTKVKVVWNGQEKEFTPISSAGGGGPEGPGPGRKSGPRPPPPSGGAPVVVTGTPPGPGRSAGLGGLSPEERERRREQFKNMSPEERQRFLEEMRQRSGRGGQ